MVLLHTLVVQDIIGGDRRSCKSGADFKYTSAFYEKLFSNRSSNKNYGKIVAEAKEKQIGASSKNGTERWVQFGLNPIGDPEMPIYVSEPKQFEENEITSTSGTITINTGSLRCWTCIMSADDDGESYYKVYNGTQNIQLRDLPLNSIICMTLQGYIPDVYRVRIIQNETLTGDREYDCDMVKIGDWITSQCRVGPVVVKSGTTTINASDVTIGSMTVEQGAELIINNNK